MPDMLVLIAEYFCFPVSLKKKRKSVWKYACNAWLFFLSLFFFSWITYGLQRCRQANALVSGVNLGCREPCSPSLTNTTHFVHKQRTPGRKKKEARVFSVDLLWFLVLTVTYNQYWAEIRPFARPLCVPLRRFKRSRTRSGRHLSFNLGWGGGGGARRALVTPVFPQLIVLLVGFSCVSWAQQTPAAALKFFTDTHFFGVTVAFSPPHKYLKPSSLLA